VLYASHAQFTQTNVIPEFLSDGIGGVTEHEKGRVVLPFAVGLGETDHVLGHELVHAFQRDILTARDDRWRCRYGSWKGWRSISPSARSIRTPPCGYAIRLNRMRCRVSISSTIPHGFPYRYGQALWAYLAQRFGEDVIVKSLKSKGPGRSHLTHRRGHRVDERSLSSGWHEFIRASVTRSPTAQAGTSADHAHESPAETSAARVLGGKSAGSRLDVGPTMSPDGMAVAFFHGSQSTFDRHGRGRYADRRDWPQIVKTDSDPHFDSLQFIESAGAFDHDGHRLAVAALSGGVPVLTILNRATGGVECELAIHDVDQIFSPTWSPDGTADRLLVLHKGFSDLAVIDLETGTVRALTSDAFADVHPSWSPDGRTIAFSTDRFSSSLDTLTFGDFRWRSIDVESGSISELPSIPHAKNIDPHWAPDGGSLYFIADAEGRATSIAPSSRAERSSRSLMSPRCQRGVSR
jgi:hypothetical protein